MMGTGYSGWWGWGEWHWTLRFARLPTKMDNGKIIWWKEYYHGIKMISGPAGESPVILHQYITPQEFLINTLKKP